MGRRWVTVVVDDYFPCTQDSAGLWQPLFAHSKTHDGGTEKRSELWRCGEWSWWSMRRAWPHGRSCIWPRCAAADRRAPRAYAASISAEAWYSRRSQYQLLTCFPGNLYKTIGKPSIAGFHVQDPVSIC